MFNFTKKNEYETLSKRILDVEVLVSRLNADVANLELENKGLRDQVLRKIQEKKNKYF